MENLIVYDIVEHETNTKGFWLNNGKVYVDNIKEAHFPFKECNGFKNLVNELFITKKQEAIFYIQGNKAYIEHKNGKIDVLSQRIQWIDKFEPSKDYIRTILELHKGLTIDKDGDYYILTIWKE